MFTSNPYSAEMHKIYHNGSKEYVTILPYSYCNHAPQVENTFSGQSDCDVLYEAALFCHISYLLIICISVYL